MMWQPTGSSCLLLLNHLQTERDKEDEVAWGALPPVDCQEIPVEENDDNEPMLVDEEVEEVKEELLPYKLTNYYQQQCLHFEAQFNQWVGNYKI
jgi:hypothetical protein